MGCRPVIQNADLAAPNHWSFHQTRCSGGYPCDRCAAHKVPCQFDRDLIYRSPLASNSQQASARNAQVLNNLDTASAPAPKARARTTNANPTASSKQAAKRGAAASAPQQTSQPSPQQQHIPVTTSHADPAPSTARSTPSPPAPPRPIQPVIPSQNLSTISRKAKSTISTPVPAEAFVNYDPHSPAAVNHSILLRLATLENNVSGLVQALRSRAPSPAPRSRCAKPEQSRGPSPFAAPPALIVSSSTPIGPERDHSREPNRVGFASATATGDPLSEGILDATQVNHLYDM